MFHRISKTENGTVLTMLRLVLGVIFFAHGAQKLLGWFGGRGLSGSIAFYQNQGVSPVLGFLCIPSSSWAAWR